MVEYYQNNDVSVRETARVFGFESKKCWFWLKKIGVKIRNEKNIS